jgi:hypothetical protein
VFNVKAALSSLVVLAALVGAGCGVTTEEEGVVTGTEDATLEAAEKKKCDYRDPTVRFVSTDPAECQLIFFVCNPGETPFFNECGCGCVLPR